MDGAFIAAAVSAGGTVVSAAFAGLAVKKAADAQKESRRAEEMRAMSRVISQYEGRSTPRMDFDERQVYVNQAWASIYGLQVVLREACEVLSDGRAKNAIQTGMQFGQAFLEALRRAGATEQDGRRIAEDQQMLAALKTLRWKYRDMYDAVKDEYTELAGFR